MTHTPGPWRARKPISNGIADYTIVSKEKIVAFCPTGRPFDNVRLIAAAPDLLEACKYAVEMLPHYVGPSNEVFNSAIRGLERAIDQAEAKDE